MQPRQLVLPELGEPRAPGAATAIDDASGEFLARYEAERGKEVAAATAPSEVSQLRVIARADPSVPPAPPYRGRSPTPPARCRKRSPWLPTEVAAPASSSCSV